MLRVLRQEVGLVLMLRLCILRGKVMRGLGRFPYVFIFISLDVNLM